METWITWTSRYSKKQTETAHQVRGVFDTAIQMRTRCGERVAGRRATLASPGVPRCRKCSW